MADESTAVAARLLEPEFDVVTTACDGRVALAAVARLDPDVLILDISMPVRDGLETARRLRADGSRARIVFLTVHGDPDYVRAGFAAGASGYVVKSRLASDLLPAVREALAGRPYVSPSISLE